MKFHDPAELHLWLLNEEIERLYEERDQYIKQLEKKYCSDEVDSLIHLLAHKSGYFPHKCIYEETEE